MSVVDSVVLANERAKARSSPGLLNPRLTHSVVLPGDIVSFLVGRILRDGGSRPHGVHERCRGPIGEKGRR